MLKPLGNSLPAQVASHAYGALVKLRTLYYDTVQNATRDGGRPAISVGCVHAGGTGKTPTALLIAQTLAAEGYSIAFLSRGYGRPCKQNVIVAPRQQIDWEFIGDEPALLHDAMPQAWLGIGADRLKNAIKLSAQLPQKAVFILDDGFSHRRLRRNLDIVCLPPDPFSDYLIPAGFLREPLQNLKRAHALTFICSESAELPADKNRDKLLQNFPGVKILELKEVIGGWVDLQTGQTAERPPLKAPALVCAIARPERFTGMVERQGIKAASINIFN
ncbi:MAG: tetraacyldisaccharide 4'-kinase, partial [Chitinivibrionales bacterium]|nr:tetraacyldisaccharide 4'-kinase [Chitinivibrionales bacterium]